MSRSGVERAVDRLWHEWSRGWSGIGSPPRYRLYPSWRLIVVSDAAVLSGPERASFDTLRRSEWTVTSWSEFYLCLGQDRVE